MTGNQEGRAAAFAPATLAAMVETGRRILRELGTDRPLVARFVWNEVPFRVRVQIDGGKRLEIEAELGPVPFTAENPEGRAACYALARHADPALPGRYAVAGGSLHFLGRTHLPTGAGNQDLLIAIITWLLLARPFLVRRDSVPERHVAPRHSATG